MLRFYDEFSQSAPDELTTVGAVVTVPDGTPAFATVVCYCGALTTGEDVVQPLRAFGPPLVDLIGPRPYVEMQIVFDEAWPPGRRSYNKVHNIRMLNAGAIQTVLEYAQSLPTPLSNIAFQQLHGAASRVPVDATAFPHRYAHYDLLVHPATDDPADDGRMIQWARACWEALAPFVERAVYVNAVEDAAEEGERLVREAYGTNYERLVELKPRYDPTNRFRLNSNITPQVTVG